MTAAAAVAETHISVLVSIGDRVYKLKKPVSFGFVDFSTRESRLQFRDIGPFASPLEFAFAVLHRRPDDQW